MATSFLPATVLRSFGEWPCTSALGLCTRRYSALKSNVSPLSNATVMALRSLCSRNSVGQGLEASPSIFHSCTSAAGDEALREREAVLRDVAGARDPDPVLALVLDAMLDRLAQRAQSKRLPDDEAVQREGKDERLALRLLQHFLELIDDHLAKFAPGVIAVRLGAGVVQFHGIR